MFTSLPIPLLFPLSIGAPVNFPSPITNTLIKSASTSLNSKVVSPYSSLLAPLVVEVVLYVLDLFPSMFTSLPIPLPSPLSIGAPVNFFSPTTNTLIKSASTSLNSKVVSPYSSLLAPLIVEVVLYVLDLCHPDIVNLRDVCIVKNHDDTVDDLHDDVSNRRRRGCMGFGVEVCVGYVSESGSWMEEEGRRIKERMADGGGGWDGRWRRSIARLGVRLHGEGVMLEETRVQGVADEGDRASIRRC